MTYLFLWIVFWLGLTAKRRWNYKLPPIDTYGIIRGPVAAHQPLLITRNSNSNMDHKMTGGISTASSTDCVEDIYWPKPSSPKLKVTFSEVTSTCEEQEQDGKR